MPHRAEQPPPAYGHAPGSTIREISPPRVSPAGRMARHVDGYPTPSPGNMNSYGGPQGPPLTSRLPPPDAMWNESEAPKQPELVEREGSNHLQGGVGTVTPTLKKRKEPSMPSETPEGAKKNMQSGESAEQAAASALLMASSSKLSAAEYRKGSTNNLTISSEEGTTGAEASKSNEAPSQKRKKHLDVLRRNGDHQADGELVISSRPPYHVSPVSSASLGSNIDGHPSDPNMQSDSFELKEGGQVLPASSQVRDAADIAASGTHMDIPHFPSILHTLLGHHDFKNVFQWLPHGKAWKVVRWDALRRETMPQHFPHLCQETDGSGKPIGSIDGFLRHVRGWGFEEIKDGPDCGAYHHVLFVRGSPKLCKNMSFGDLEEPPKKAMPRTIKRKTPDTSSYPILRVPSLVSGAEAREHATRQIPDQERAWENQHRMHMEHEHAAMAARHGRLPPSYGEASMYEHLSPFHQGWAHHRYIEEGGVDHRYYSTMDSPRGGQHPLGFPPHYDSRSPLRAQGLENPLNGPSHQYSTPTVCSNRGGARSTRGGAAAAAASAAPRPARSSFPVSQRGKSLGRPRPLPSLGSSDSNESPRGFGPHLQHPNNVAAFGISRRTTPPLARKPFKP